MRTYSIKDLPAVQQKWVRANMQAGIRGMRSTAHRAKAFYVQRIDKTHAVDTGRMKSSFQIVPLPNGALLSNATTYFSVIDKGRRPGAPGPPLRPILEWVLRKRIVQRKGKGLTRARVVKSLDLMSEAYWIAVAIRRKIHRKGIKARNIASGAAQVKQVLSFLVEEVAREARKVTP